MKKIDCYVVDTLGDFDKEVVRFVKKKRYKRLPDQIEELEEQLIKGDFPGDLIKREDTPVPHEIYKLRLPNPDTNKGKSNGYRVYYLVVTEQRLILLMFIYYKKEQETVSSTFIDGLVNGFFLDAMPYDDSEDADH